MTLCFHCYRCGTEIVTGHIFKDRFLCYRCWDITITTALEATLNRLTRKLKKYHAK